MTTATQDLTLGGAVDFVSITMGAAQTWDVASGRTLTFSAVGGTLANGGNLLTVQGAGSTTISGLISGTGGLSKSGTGTLTLGGTNTFGGTLTIGNGTLNIGTINNDSANGALGNSANSVTLGSSGNTGTLQYTGSTASSTKKFTMATSGTGAFQIDNSGTTLTLSGLIDGSGGLNKTGAGTLTLSGTDTYSGSTIVSAGTLSISGSINSSPTVQVNGGTLSTTGADKLANTADVTVAGGTLTIGGSDTVSTLTMSSGSIGGSQTLTATTYGLSGGTVTGKLGTGTLNSSGNVALNGTAGATAVNVTAGNLTLGSNDRLADGATVTVSGGTLAMGANTDTVSIFNMSSGSITGSGTLTATTYGLSGGTVTGNLGTGTLNSSGTVALDGTAGATAVNVTAGTLTLGSNNRLADGATVTISGGGTLAMGANNDTVASVVLTDGSITGTGGTLTGTSTHDVRKGTVSAILGGSVGLTKTTVDSVTLSGANTYTGATTVKAGTLVVGADAPSGSAGALGNATSAVLLGDTTGSSDASLLTGGAFTVGRAVTVQSGNTGVITLGGNTANASSFTGNIVLNKSANLTAASGGTVTISTGVVSGTGGITKVNSGTVTLTGNNTFSGATAINAGTLEAGAAGALGGTSGITVNTGGTLLLSGSGDRIKDTATLTMAGGTFSTGGNSETLGTLTLSDNSTLDFGTGSSVLHLANSSGASWTSGKILTINNWSGSYINGGGTDQLFLGSTSGGLTSGQLAEIIFHNPASLGAGDWAARILSTGEVVPVPEPSTWAGLGGLAGLLGWRERRRFRSFGARLGAVWSALDANAGRVRLLVLSGFACLIAATLFILP